MKTEPAKTILTLPEVQVYPKPSENLSEKPRRPKILLPHFEECEPKLAKTGKKPAPAKKNFKETLGEETQTAQLEVISMHHITNQSRMNFLAIKEREFPHLFKNPVVQHQKMSKFLDEIDFNSDSETVERNQSDLLSSLFTAISKYNKSEPGKFVENLKKSEASSTASSDRKTNKPLT